MHNQVIDKTYLIEKTLIRMIHQQPQPISHPLPKKEKKSVFAKHQKRPPPTAEKFGDNSTRRFHMISYND